MTVSKLNEGLGLIEGGIRAFGDIDWNEHRLTKARLGILRMLVCCEDILEEKKFISPDVL
jgi:hypothetical protein